MILIDEFSVHNMPMVFTFFWSTWQLLVESSWPLSFIFQPLASSYFESIVNIHCSVNVINHSSRNCQWDQWLVACHFQILILPPVSRSISSICFDTCLFMNGHNMLFSTIAQGLYNYTLYSKDPTQELYFPWLWEFDVMGLLCSYEHYMHVEHCRVSTHVY